MPAWVGRAVMQGLRVDPLERPVSMEALLSTLDNHPEVKRQAQRRLTAVAVGGVLLAGLAIWGWARQQAQEPVCGQVVQRRMDGVWDGTVKARLSEALVGIGNALSYLGRHKEAREQHARALALSEKALGPDHPLVALALTVLSAELVSLGRHGEAQQRINRAQTILEKALGKEHPDLAYVLVVQGELRLAKRKFAEAVPLLEQALKLAPKGGAHVEVQFALARALGKAKPSERARAVGLATEARDEWQRFGHASKAAEASKWLAGHAAL